MVSRNENTSDDETIAKIFETRQKEMKGSFMCSIVRPRGQD